MLNPTICEKYNILWMQKLKVEIGKLDIKLIIFHSQMLDCMKQFKTSRKYISSFVQSIV